AVIRGSSGAGAQMAIRSRTVLGVNCASVTTAAAANVSGVTVTTANKAAPISNHLDLIRIPHLVLTRNRLAEGAFSRQLCCAISSFVTQFWVKPPASGRLWLGWSATCDDAAHQVGASPD